MKCKHKWKIIDKTILTHPIADAMRNEARRFVVDDIRVIQDRVIYVFQCELCFEVKIEEK